MSSSTGERVKVNTNNRNRVTLADLSRKTGLSQATISMILARRSDVSFSDETVRLVHETAHSLGYVPVGRKQISLFTRRTILVVCPMLLNYYYADVVQVIQSSAAKVQCNTLIYTTYREPEEENRILRVMTESDIGGVVFAMVPQSRKLVEELSKNTPVVIIGDPEPDLKAAMVPLHNHLAGSLVARHLISLGHRHVVCVSTVLGLSNTARMKRYEGICHTFHTLCPEGTVRLLTRQVSHPQERDHLEIEHSIGYDLAREALKAYPDITAFIAINDMLGYGVLDALSTAGFKVPRDYSVCGLDNDFPSDFAGVRLTSVRHFMSENASNAFDMLYFKMSGFVEGTEIIKDYKPELIIRDSTSKVRVDAVRG